MKRLKAYHAKAQKNYNTHNWVPYNSAHSSSKYICSICSVIVFDFDDPTTGYSTISGNGLNLSCNEILMSEILQ